MILVMVESWTAGRSLAAQASRKHARRVQAQVAQFRVEFAAGAIIILLPLLARKPRCPIIAPGPRPAI
jgi:hypothetical protein